MANIDFSQYKRVPKEIDFSQYKRIPKGDSWGPLIGKSVAKGIISIADIPKLAVRGIEAGALYLPDEIDEINDPSIPGYVPNFDVPDFIKERKTIIDDVGTPFSSKIPSSEDIRIGIKNITGIDIEPRPTTAAKRIVSKGAEFAGSLLGFGGVGAAKQGIREVAKLGGTGAVTGAGSGLLQESGVNPLAADIASSLVTPVASKNLLNVFRRPVETAAKIPLKIMGLSPKRLNIEAAEAAKDLGIELPAAALTDSTLTGLADQWVRKTPFFGNKLKKKDAITEEQTRKALGDIYERTGPVRTPEIEAEIANRYNLAASSLPENAKIKPSNLKKAIDDIKIDTAILSSDEKNLLQSLGTIRNEIEPLSKIVSQYGPIKVPLQEYDVSKLIGTKKSLNSIINWDSADEGVKKLLRKVQKAVTQDIAEYGKTNPEWYKNFQDADNLFKKVARREKVENALGKSIASSTDNLSYANLSKAINSADKQKILKKQLDPETFEKIQKLGTVARAMAVKSANVPNPSGTAMTTATLGLIGSLYANPIATLQGSGIAGIGGAYVASQLLTDKKFLDLALKLVKTPNNQMVVKALNNRVKAITGYSAVVLNNKIQRDQGRE